MKFLSRLVLVVAGCLYATVAAATFASFQVANNGTPSFTPAWSTLKLGAGGQITRTAVSPDNTTVSRNDTLGAHLRNSTGTCNWGATVYTAPCWQQLVTVQSLGLSQAAALTTMNNLNTGVVEIEVAPNNTNVAYMITDGKLFVTTNLKAGSPVGSGVTWAQVSTGQWSTTQSGNTNGSKERSKYIAIDPTNPDNVVAVASSGVYRSSNGTSGASATFTKITLTGSPGTTPDLVFWDPNSSTHLFIGVDGTGVYESTTGPSGTFTLTSGTQTQVYKIWVDKFSQLWLLRGTAQANIYRRSTTTWATLPIGATDDWVNIATDPTSSATGTNRIVLTSYGGQPNISNDNGATWGGANTNETISTPASQPSWIANANQTTGGTSQIFLNTLDISFDTSGNLWNSTGIGAARTAAPIVSSATVWTMDTLGIEQLVNVGVISPPGSPPLVDVWDRGFYVSYNPDVFPTSQWSNVIPGPVISDGWALDYASANPFCVTGWQGRSANTGGNSTDGGKTWAKFGTFPTSTNISGNIAASTCLNWVLFPGGTSAQRLSVTTDGGANWANSTIAGTPQFNSQNGVRFSIAADRVTSGSFCAVDLAQNFYNSTNSGVTFNGPVATVANVDPAAGQDTLVSMPGQAGTYFYSPGSSNTAHPNSTRLFKSTNSCATWTAVQGTLIREVIDIGFGSAPPSGSNATIYYYGWYNGVLGIYFSTDIGTTWNPINVPVGQTTFPMGSLGFPYAFSGDNNVYGRIYMGLGGNGYGYIDTADACPWVGWTSSFTPGMTVSGTMNLTAQRSGLVTPTSVNFYVDGVLIGTQTSGTGTPTTYAQSWNTSGVIAGAHTLKVEAVGNGCTAGGGGNSFSIPVTK